MACMSSVFMNDDRNESDNQPSVYCQLAEGHSGTHRHCFTKLGKHGKQGEVVEWTPILTTPKIPMNMRPAARDDRKLYVIQSFPIATLSEAPSIPT